MTNQWGFPVCEDGDVGGRVVALSVPGDVTGVDIGYRVHAVMNLHRICPIP